MGRALFRVLGWLLFLFCLVEGVRLTADCLSEERREGTLGLLFLAEVRPLEIILGKLVGVALNSLYALLAALPALAFPILLGGVTGGEFGRLCLLLVVTLMLSLTAGLMVSSWAVESLQAWGWTCALLAGIVLGPVGVGFFLEQIGVATPIADLSPLSAMIGLESVTQGVRPWAYWQGIGAELAAIAGCLAVSCLVLPRHWERAAAARRPGAGPAGRRRRGSPDLNPGEWLARRHGWDPRAACIGVVAGVAALVILILLHPSTGVATAAVGVALCGVSFYGLLFWQALVAVRVGADLRGEGGGELLLITPVHPRTWALGLGAGLVRQVLPVGLLLVAGGLLFAVMAGGLAAARGGGNGAATFLLCLLGLGLGVGGFLDLWGVCWLGLHQGLSRARRSEAIAWTLCWTHLVPMLLWALCTLGGPLLVLLKSLIVLLWARDQLLFGFSRMVRAPYEQAGVRGEPLSSPPSRGRDLPDVTP